MRYHAPTPFPETRDCDRAHFDEKNSVGRNARFFVP